MRPIMFGIFLFADSTQKATFLGSLLWFFLAACFVECLLPEQLQAVEDTVPVSQLKQLDINDLLNLEVSSVSKTPQKYFKAGAAIYVLTSEDIQRSGVTTIPDALRMVPGLQVAKIDSNKWSVSSRGFAGRFSNKLQVLMDGRSVYSPAFSGTMWDIQDTFLEDIDRIEVIRGPGASLWGANAVNGVINIITKKAQDTQGIEMTSLVGTEEQGLQGRYGGKIGEDTAYRIYVKARNNDKGGRLDMDSEDEWDEQRGGFRIDWKPLSNNAATLQGDIYAGSFGENITLPDYTQPTFTSIEDETIQKNGGNILFRYKHTYTETSNTTFQAYYDRMVHDEYICQYDSNIIDLDIQHRFTLGSWNDILIGAGFRSVQDSLTNSDVVVIEDATQTNLLSTGFIQDQIEISPNFLQLTLGSKFEHSDAWGDAIEPSARIVMTPNDQNTLWASVSRAVRSPSRGEQSVLFSTITTQETPGGQVPVLAIIECDNDFEKEWLTAYELGYRIMPIETFSVDIAAFYNRYDDLRTASMDGDTAQSNIFAYIMGDRSKPAVVPVTLTNKMHGHTYGTEFTLEWKPTPEWRLEGTYSFLKMHLEIDGDEYDSEAATNAEDSPQNQVSIRSMLDLGKHVQFDLWGRYVDSLHISDQTRIPSYTTLDARLAWSPTPAVELSIVGQNLLNPKHQEFSAQNIPVAATYVQRSVYMKMIFRF